MSEQVILQWVHSQFCYPHCLRSTSIGSFKTGVALAEMLTHMLPDIFHAALLPNIEISDLSVQKSMANLRAVLSILGSYLSHTNISEMDLRMYTVQGLYYRQSEMLNFLSELMQLQRKIQQEGFNLGSYPSTIAAHTQIGTNNISQLSEIGNFSTLMGRDSREGFTYQVNKKGNHLLKLNQESKGESECEDDCQQSQIALPISQVELLQSWLKVQLKMENLESPAYAFGRILNKIFCNTRFKDPIIKQAHFVQGPLAICRKGLNFILTNEAANRISKQSALTLSKSIQNDGTIRQTSFWLLISDLYQFQNSKAGTGNRKKKEYHKREKLIEQFEQVEKQKQNLSENRNAEKNKNQQYLISCYSGKQLQDAERWVGKQMGYSYSLEKSRISSQVLNNPLLNGSLVSSILMRLKIGRPLFIKNPKKAAQVSKNWEQIHRVCAARGYQCLRKQSFIQKPSFDAYLGLLGELKAEHANRDPQPSKNKSSKQSESKRNEEDEKQEIKKWLQQKYSIAGINTSSLSVKKLTQICGELLDVNIYRATTSKIQQNNVQKILCELRRMGLGQYYQISQQQVLQKYSDDLRWKIVGDLKWLLQGQSTFQP